jgi:hypothetical protein
MFCFRSSDFFLERVARLLLDRVDRVAGVVASSTASSSSSLGWSAGTLRARAGVFIAFSSSSLLAAEADRLRALLVDAGMAGLQVG